MKLVTRIDNILTKLDVDGEISRYDGYYLISYIDDLIGRLNSSLELRNKMELKIERLQKQIKKLKGIK